jgi:hypothetical protein
MACPIGYLHIGIAEVRTVEGTLHMFVAVDRTPLSTCTKRHHRHLS